MIVNVGTTPTKIQYVNRGDIIFNTGLTVAYVDTVQANVVQAPQSSAVPVNGGGTIQWAGVPGLLYGKDPTGSAPGIGVTSHSGLPFPAPTGGPNFLVNNQGFFWYSPTPAKGNLVVAIAPNAAGHDPFGDVYPQGTNFGVWNASGVLMAHFGIDVNGNAYLADTSGNTRVQISNGTSGFGSQVGDPGIVFFNSFGAIILIVDPQRGGTFQYFDNNSAVQGGLIGAQVGKNTTDPVLGNVISAGVNIINPVFGDTTRVTGSIIVVSQLNWNNPSQIAASGGNPAGAVGPSLNFDGPFQTAGDCLSADMFGDSPDGTVLAGWVLARQAAHGQLVKATSGLLELQAGAMTLGNMAASPASVAGYVQVYADQFNQLHTDRAFQTDDHIEIKNLGSSPGAGGSGVKLWSRSGHSQSQSGQAGIGGDTNNYDVERLTLLTPNPSGAGQIINSTLLTILSKPIGIGTYHLHGTLVYQGNQAGGVPTISFSGPAVSGNTSQLGRYSVLNTGATQPIPLFIRGALGSFAGPTLVNAQFVEFEYDVFITTTTAGTFTVSGQSSILNDTFTIQALSNLEINPVVAT